MKFSINREDWLKPLQQVASVVEKRQTLPVLANVLLDVTANQLVITGTDLEIEMVARLPLTGDVEEGSITLPARKLADICKSLPADADMVVELVKDKVTILSGKGRFSLLTLPAADFPSLEAETGDKSFRINPSKLHKLINSTAFSMAQQDVRYYLNGMLIELNADGLRSVATDGHRLALANLALDADIASEALQIILPRKGILELLRLLNDNSDEVEVFLARNFIRVALPHFQFTSKLVDGKFPDYERVIPRGNAFLATIDKEVLRHSLSRVLVLSNEKYRGVRLQFSAGKLTLQTNNPAQEEAEEELSINYDGDVIDIGFNITYLLDILNNVDGSQITVSLGDSNSSALIQDPEDDSAIYVVMPMRL